MGRDAAAPDGRLMPLLRWALTCCCPPPNGRPEDAGHGVAVRRWPQPRVAPGPQQRRSPFRGTQPGNLLGPSWREAGGRPGYSGREPV